MKLAFIGASHWHLPLYLDPALDAPGTEIAGVSDPDAAVVRRLAERLGCAGDTDYRTLVRKVKPDFVIALGRHADMVAEATFLLEEGVPFAIEKPCGLNARDVEGLAALEARTGGFAAVPLVIRNGEFGRRLIGMAAEGVTHMSFRFIAGFASRYQDAGCEWMLDPALSGGGCTINLAPHFFDLCHQMLGPDVEVRQATMSNAGWGHPVEDYSAVTLAHGQNICVIETGYLYPAPTSSFDMHFAVRTPREYLVAPDQDIVHVVDRAGRRETIRTPTTNVPHYRTFVLDVLDRVRTGAPPLVRIADLVPTMRLIDRAYDLAGPLKVARVA